jgi:hypothetical protein
MSEADILEIYEADGVFYEHEWIGTGKKEHVNLPDFVKTAREAARLVPDNVLTMAYLPSPNVLVADFVAWDLPHLSSEIISTKAEMWFSKDLSSISIHVLLSRPVPSAMKLFRKRTPGGNSEGPSQE